LIDAGFVNFKSYLMTIYNQNSYCLQTSYRTSSSKCR